MNLKSNFHKPISNQSKLNKGFTILELMFVVVIIGVIAALITNNILLYKKGAYNADARSEAKNFYSYTIAYITGKEENVTIDLLDNSTLPEGFNKKDDIIYNGKFEYDQGEIYTDASFRHYKSNNTYTVSTDGVVKKEN